MGTEWLYINGVITTANNVAFSYKTQALMTSLDFTDFAFTALTPTVSDDWGFAIDVLDVSAYTDLNIQSTVTKPAQYKFIESTVWTNVKRFLKYGEVF